LQPGAPVSLYHQAIFGLVSVTPEGDQLDDDYTPWGGGSRARAYRAKPPRLDFSPDSQGSRDAQYQAALSAACPHGRRRAVHGHGQDVTAGLECTAGKCGFVVLSFAAIARQWVNAPDTSAALGPRLST
jgi:hypothetical protein